MKNFAILLTVVMLFGMTGCSGQTPSSASSSSHDILSQSVKEYTFTDDIGRQITLKETPKRVLACGGSLGQIWTLAGGSLLGVTEDASDVSGLVLAEGTLDLGSVKTPSAEKVLEAEADFVLLSANITGHKDIGGLLDTAGIPYGYFEVEAFEDYLRVLKTLTEITGDAQAYDHNGEAVAKEIATIQSNLDPEYHPSVLLIRAFSTGAKAKGDDTLAGVMLREMGCNNLVDLYPSMLEDLSLEKILETDPEYIFVTTMGGTEEALAAFKESYTSHPAWGSLTAVQEGRFIVLPKDLFHQKPNNRWNESYRMLYEVLYEGR